MDIVWINKDLPVGYDIDGRILIKSVDKFYRPNEVQTLLGDSSKARKELGWKPQYDFDALVKDMVVNKLQEYK